jgi:hypothetical protein
VNKQTRLYLVMGNTLTIGEFTITALSPASLVIEHPADLELFTYLDEPIAIAGDQNDEG